MDSPESARASARLEKLSPEQTWLNLQCEMLQDVTRGYLFRISSDGVRARLDACWPRLVVAREGMQRKVLVCAEGKRPFHEVVGEGDGADEAALLRVFQPVDAGDASFVAVLDIPERDGNEQRTVVNLLRWNSEWLSYAMQHDPGAKRQDVMAMLSLAVTVLEQDSFQALGTSLVTELAARFGCQRVSLGLRRGGRTHVKVLSHSAQLKQETNLVQSIAAAMDEAADQDRAVVHPATPSTATAISHAQQALSRQDHGCSVCSIPISDGGQLVGALTLERDVEGPFEEFELLQVEQVLALVASALHLKHEDEKGIHRKAWGSLRRLMRGVFGAGQVRLKLATLCLIGFAAFAYFATGDWRVTADAVVEGRIQRTVAAPIDGFIASADARAGDVVSAGQQIGSLDDSDLRLERLKWTTLRQQMVSELRDARARNSRAEVSITTAKIEQANAELELVDEKLARTRLKAPFDGMVIEGDLSQRLGTPVKRGDPLFRIAPLDDFRVVLRVSEQDAASVETGQAGRLVLASLPGQALELEVTRVIPVSTPEGGRNYFRVEAQPGGDDALLQPGMEGVGKIRIGERRLVWIWTHDLVNWLRLQTWTWWR